MKPLRLLIPGEYGIIGAADCWANGMIVHRTIDGKLIIFNTDRLAIHEVYWENQDWHDSYKPMVWLLHDELGE